MKDIIKFIIKKQSWAIFLSITHTELILPKILGRGRDSYHNMNGFEETIFLLLRGCNILSYCPNSALG